MPMLDQKAKTPQRLALDAVLAAIKAGGERMGDCDACDLYVPREHRHTCMAGGSEGTFCPVCRGTSVPDYIEELQAEWGPFELGG